MIDKRPAALAKLGLLLVPIVILFTLPYFLRMFGFLLSPMWNAICMLLMVLTFGWAVLFHNRASKRWEREAKKFYDNFPNKPNKAARPPDQ